MLPGAGPLQSISRSPAVSRILLPAAVTVVLAAGIGLNLRLLPAMAPVAYVVLPVLAGATAYVLSRRSTWPIVALIAVSIFGLFTHSVKVGPIDLRLTDVVFAAMAVWAIRARRQDPARRSGDVAQRALGIFIVLTGLSLLPVVIQHPNDLTTSAISWLRFAQTLCLVWLVPYALRGPDDHRLVINAVALFGAVEIYWSIFYVNILGGGIVDRLGGANGPNTTGLIAGILVLIAAHSPTPSRRHYRIALAVAGILGLVLTRSNGAAVATAVSFAVFGVTSRAVRRRNRQISLTGPIRILLVGVALIVVLMSLRPQNLPGSRDFNQTSTAQRIILGRAGIELFLHNPILGVGWQRSQLKDVIGDPEISDRLRQQFSRETRKEFFPDQSPTNVHNAYVQVLAETGIVGFATMVALLVGAASRIRRIVHAAQWSPWFGPWAAVYPPLLLALLVWWNDNALFGAQPETIFLGLFLGCLRAIGSSVALERRAASV